MTTGKVAALKRADRVLMAATIVLLVGGSTPLGFHLYTNEFRTPAVAERAPLTPMLSLDEMRARRDAIQSRCLAEVLYYEARGEGEAGEKAVAEVVLERTHSRYYPHTICGVVHEGADQPGRSCQFSFACDGALERPKDAAAWQRAQTLAAKILAGEVKLHNETGHAIAYHSASVAPYWADDMLMTAQIGNHVFYRRMPLNRARLPEQNAADEPMVPVAVSIAAEDIPLPKAPPSEEVQPDVQIAGAVGDGT